MRVAMSSGNGVFDLSIFLACFLLFAFIDDVVVVGSLPRTTSIVYMDKSQMPKPFASHHHWYSSAVTSLSAAGSEEGGPSLLYTYDNAVHGFSALLSRGELEALKSVPGFVSAHSDKELTPETTHTPEFLSLNAVSGAWPASDYGRDVIIGVIDSGVWPESKSFGDDGMKNTPIPSRWKGVCEEGDQFTASMCNAKLIGARSFNKGLRARDQNGVNISMNSARDTDGHGTHTAATAAGNYVPGTSFFGYANGTARGIAPRARLAVYKVLWDEGAVESDFLAAVDQAVADGVDVISLSIGSRVLVPLYENTIAIAAFGAMEKGVFVSTSAGNQGPTLGSISKGIPWALVVAAGTIDRKFAGTLTLENGVTIVGWSMFPARTFGEQFSLVYNKTLSPCNSSTLLAEAPSAAIICDQMGIVSEQLEYVAASRAAAAIFIADEYEIANLRSFPCAGVVISPKEAAAVIEYAQNGSGNPTVGIRFHQTFTGIKPAPAVARYSSRGPSPSLRSVLKPDVMAPGSQVLAAWIQNGRTAQIGLNWYLSSDYNIISGTSMACPHASGAAALLKGAHPEWSPAAIRSALMTTANPFDNALDPIRDVGEKFSFASPLASGSGQIDPNRALDPGLIYDIAPADYLQLLCSLNFTKEEILTITRSSSHECSSNHSAPDLNYPSFIALYDFQSTRRMVRTFRRTVTNVGGGAATYEVKVKPPRDSAVSVLPNKLTFGKKYEKQSYTLTISYKGNRKGRVSHGSIIWTEVGGKRAARSPIVVSPPYTAFD